MAKKPATADEKRHMDRVASLGCIIENCRAPVTIHHCGTYMGGGRNHLKVLPLCWEHHLGKMGIDGKQISKTAWQAKFGTEEALLKLVDYQLND